METVEVVIHPAVWMDFLAGEAVDVCVSEQATLGNRVAKGIVAVFSSTL
jgi:hypothetical protein